MILNNIEIDTNNKKMLYYIITRKAMNYADRVGMCSRIHDTVSSFAFRRGSRLGNSNDWPGEISPSLLSDIGGIGYIDKVASDR